MTTVNTATGPVDASTLGFTLSHEHVLIAPLWKELPFLYDREETLRRVTAALTEAKQGGIDTVIELTTIDLGREVPTMAEAARASGMNVVVATGIWRDIPRFFWGRDPDFIARFMFHEIEHGIEDTGVRPGVIKVANDAEGVTEEGERVLRAAARVAKATGVPISTHHWAPAEVGRRQVEVFLDEGVPMHLVAIGHSADTTDDKYLEDLLETGCYLSMDRYPGGFGGRPDWRARNATVKRLVDRGWAPRLMLGHDYAPRAAVVGVSEPPSEPGPVRYLFVKNVAIPALMADSVSEEQVRLMTVEAPKRFLTGETPLPRENGQT